MEQTAPASRSPVNRWIQSPFRLLVSILICNLAGVLGSVVTVTGEGSWYASIQKPAFNPPGFIFGPVWTTLYILMGIALYLVWMEGITKRKVRYALFAFGVQLGLNVLWSFLFFGMRSPFLGLVEIVFLWIAIAVTIILFNRVHRTAAWLLVPYLAWVSFAAFLTYNIWLLNG